MSKRGRKASKVLASKALAGAHHGTRPVPTSNIMTTSHISSFESMYELASIKNKMKNSRRACINLNFGSLNKFYKNRRHPM